MGNAVEKASLLIGEAYLVAIVEPAAESRAYASFVSFSASLTIRSSL